MTIAIVLAVTTVACAAGWIRERRLHRGCEDVAVRCARLVLEAVVATRPQDRADSA